jgi:hypothetical protein
VTSSSCGGQQGRNREQGILEGDHIVCKSVTLSVIAVTSLAVSLATDRMAFAQAGSTGGTIGKTGKSATGENGDAGEPRRKRSTGNRQVEHATGSLSGRWDWEAACPLGDHYFGDFQLTEDAGGRLTGEFLHDSGAAQGGQINGSVHGTEVSLDRSRLRSGSDQKWSATLASPKKMHGSASAGIAPCSFTATKR